MQPGALRALEFDRIVEAVTDFALTPMGAERLSRLDAVDRSAAGGPMAGGNHRDRDGSLTAHGLFPLRASSDLPQILAALGVEGRALESLRLLALATFLDSIDESRAGIRRAPGSFPLLDAATAGAVVVQGRVDAGAREDRPVGRSLRPCEPGAAADSRSAAQAEDAAAQHARVIPARQGDDKVPAGPGRVRTQRPLRPAREGRASRRASRASCTAPRPAAPACFSSRSAPSRSTTTSSRWRSRRAEEIRRILLALTDAFRQRSAAIWSARSTRRPSSDVLQATGPFLRARLTASSRRCRPTAPSSWQRHPLLRRRPRRGSRTRWR